MRKDECCRNPARKQHMLQSNERRKQNTGDRLEKCWLNERVKVKMISNVSSEISPFAAETGRNGL
jgi:hypothetical protein